MPTTVHTSPPLEEWLPRARTDNPSVPDNDLIAYWNRKHGPMRAKADNPAVSEGGLASYLEKRHVAPETSGAREGSLEESSDIVRGFMTAGRQIPQLYQGVKAGIGAAGEYAFGEGGFFTEMKEEGVKGFQEWQAEIAKTAKPSDELNIAYAEATKGNLGAFADWVQYGIGYGINQAIQAGLTAGVGALAGKLVAKTAAKKLAQSLVQKEVARLSGKQATTQAAETLVKEATKNVAKKFGRAGQLTALAGHAVGMESGEIFGDVATRSVEERRALTGEELGKAVGASLAAGALEFVGDKLGLDIMIGRTKIGGSIRQAKGLTGRLLRGAATGAALAPAEGLTEYGQTLIEEAGKGNDPFSEESLRQAINAAGLGAIGGYTIGGGAGVLTPSLKTQADASLRQEVAEEPVSKILEQPTVEAAVQAASVAVESQSSEPVRLTQDITPDEVESIIEKQLGLPLEDIVPEASTDTIQQERAKLEAMRITPPQVEGIATVPTGEVTETGEDVYRLPEVSVRDEPLPTEAALASEPEAPYVPPTEETKQRLNVAEVPVDDLSLDPERFQYKIQKGAKGETGSLAGVKTFNRNLANVIQVWREPETGKTFVVNGHNRVKLAQDLGEPTIEVKYINAATAEEARAIGATANIAEGRGTALDAAKLFRETQDTREELEAQGVPMQEKVATQGLALARLDDALFNRVVVGSLTTEQGAIIGERVESHSAQRALVKLLDERKKGGKSITNATLRELADVAERGPTQEETQTDLFGTSTEDRSLMVERAQIAAKIRQKLAHEKQLFSVVSKAQNKEELERAGNVIQQEESIKISQQAAMGLALFDKLKNVKGELSDTLNRAAERTTQEGANATLILNDTYTEVLNAIPRLARGEEAQNAGVARPEDAERIPSEAERSTIESPTETEPAAVTIPSEVSPDTIATLTRPMEKGQTANRLVVPKAQAADIVAQVEEAGFQTTVTEKGEQVEIESSPVPWKIGTEELVGFHDNQKDIRLLAERGKKVVGKLQYAEYEGELHIQNIEVAEAERRQGIGRALIEKMQAENPDKPINWGMLTEDGAKLKKAVEGVRPEEVKSQEPSPLQQEQAKLATMTFSGKSGNETQIPLTGQPKATPTQTEQANRVIVPRRRDPILPGDTFRTTSGRVTSPYPKYSTKRTTKADLIKEREWLKAEAVAEAEARGDDFNLTQFKGLDPRNWSQADGDGVNLYLFDRPEGDIGGLKVQTPIQQEQAKLQAMQAKAREKTVTKLRDLADKMDSQIEAKLNPAIGQQNLTNRRARIAAGMEAEGRSLQALQTLTRTIADQMEAGTLPKALQGIRSRAEIDFLRQAAKYKREFPQTKAEAQDWWNEARAKEVNQLKRMGITTAKQFEAAKQAIKDLQAPPKPVDTKAQQLKEIERGLIGNKIPGFFETPEPVAVRMVEMADLQPGEEVLEPSAGLGRIARAIRTGQPEAKLEVGEINATLREGLDVQGFVVTGDDFLQTTKQYDKILMNPPFEKGQDIEHVRHAYAILKPGGRVVAIMSEGPFFRGDRKATEFRGWLEDLGGTSEKLGEKAFMGAKQLRQTGANGRIVMLDKPSEAIAEKMAPYGRKQTETPEFKRWFGKSRVVDAQGKPLVVYHGTAAEFSEFSREELGRTTGARSAKEGFFFSDNPYDAANYVLLSLVNKNEHIDINPIDLLGDSKAGEAVYGILNKHKELIDFAKQKSDQVLPKNEILFRPGEHSVSFKITNKLMDIVENINARLPIPLPVNQKPYGQDSTNVYLGNIPVGRLFGAESPGIIFDSFIEKDFNVLKRGLEGYFLAEKLGVPVKRAFLRISNPKTLDNAKRKVNYGKSVRQGRGYDGIIIRNARDPLPSNHYIAFSPTQIKSALGNTGAFDPTNPSIVAQKGADYAKQLDIPFRENEDEQAARQLAGAALADLDQAGENVSATTGTVDRAGARTLGKGISPEFVKTGKIDLKGHKVNSAHDLAQVAQVYRDPRFETFRIFYTNGDEIVGHEGVSSRLPGTTAVFVDTEGKQMYPIHRFQEIRETMQKLGADGYWLLHNHPSGRSSPSQPDADTTAAFMRAVTGFRGHVVIDSNEYSVLTTGKDANTLNSETIDFHFGPDRLRQPSLQHPLLGRLLPGPEEVLHFGKDLQSPQGWVVAFYRDASGKIRGIQEVPTALFRNAQEATAFFRDQATAFGSPHILTYARAEDVHPDFIEPLIKNGVLLDHVVNNASGFSVSARDDLFIRAQPGQVLGLSMGELGGMRVAESQRYGQNDPSNEPPTQLDLFPPSPPDRPSSFETGMIEPEEGRSFLRTAKTFLRPYLLGSLGVDQIAQVYGPEQPEVAQYNTALQAMGADFLQSTSASDDIIKKWDRLPVEESDAMADIMGEARTLDYDPDPQLGQSPATPSQRQLQAKFANLSPEAQQVYRDVREFYQSMVNARFQAISDRIERVALNPKSKKAAIDKLRLAYDQLLQAVYFPLARFGDNLVIARQVQDGREVDRVMHSFESIAEAQRDAAILKAKGWRVKETVAKNYSLDQDGAASKVVGDILAIIDDIDMADMPDLYDGTVSGLHSSKEQLKEAINQIHLQALPDLSYAKHFIHAKKIKGFSRDQLRAFAHSALHGAHHLSRIRYGDKLTTALTNMDTRLNTIQEGDTIEARQVYNEMIRRHNNVLNPNTHPIAAWLGQLGFTMSLAGNIASGLTNATQVPVVTYPWLGARYGFDKAAGALQQAYQDFLDPQTFNLDSLFDAAKSEKTTDNEKAMLYELQRRGRIDITQAMDLSGRSAQDNLSRVAREVGSTREKIIQMIGFTFHAPEVMNRQVTALAAYRLAKANMQQGETADQTEARAINVAERAIVETHFIYTQENRPRYMSGNVLRVLTMFKQYSQNIAFLYGRTAHLWLADNQATVEERQIAKRQLLSMLGVQFAASGALGLPVVGSVASLLTAVANAFGDDDEQIDWEVEFRNWLAERVGKKPGEVISHGISRLTPWDMAARLGQDDLFFRTPNREREGRAAAFDWATSLSGPVLSYAVNAYLGANDIMKGIAQSDRGHFLRGVEELTPAFIRNFVKTLRFHLEGGVRTRNQYKQLDLDYAEKLGQFFGFTPARSAEMYEGITAIRNKEAAILKRRKTLLDQFASAVREQDWKARDNVLNAIRTFNQRHRTIAITNDTLMQSMSARRRRELGMEGGLYLPRTRQNLREEGAFAN